jgi:hypothetical protein
MANDGGHDLHREVFQTLLEKVQQDPYPSVTMMDMIEEGLRPEDVQTYASVLLEKIRGDAFPSLDLIQRVRALA